MDSKQKGISRILWFFTIFLNTLLLSVFINSIFLSGCSSKNEENTKLQDHTQAQVKNGNESESINIKAYDNDKPKVINNLKQIEVENLNDSKNVKVTLVLPEDWYATERVHTKALNFEYNADKNKNIKEVYEYEIFNEKKKDQLFYYGSEGLIGNFWTVSYYRDQPEMLRFPNHSVVSRKVLEGNTILGKGEIFILTVDIPDDMKRKEYSTFEMVYVWIPINSEDLAYNLMVHVPAGDKVESYIEIVKNMLKVK